MEMSLEYMGNNSVQQTLYHESQSSQAYPSRTIVHAKLKMTESGDHDGQQCTTKDKYINTK